MRSFLVFCLFISINTRKLVSVSSDLSLQKDQRKPQPDFGPNPYNDANVPLPVIFDHIGREGVGDLPSGLKQPIDLLELDMLMPKTEQEKRYHLRRKPLTDIQFIEKITPSPREKFLRVNVFENAKNNSNTRGERMWFDFEDIHNSNDRNIPKKPSSNLARSKNKEDSGKVQDVFSGGSFNLMPEFNYDYPSINWTTCDNFKATQFHPKDIVGYDWIPFYAWTTRPHVVAHLHRFSYPTLKVVQEYKDNYGPFLSSKIDWSEPKILLSDEVESLLISADRRGLFYLIRRHELPRNLKVTNSKFQLPELTVRFKIVDPYLAMMYCADHFAIIMAISGDDPQSDKEKTEEAAQLKFKGIGFPISRDIALEKFQEEAKRQRLIEEEDIKFIRAIGDVSKYDWK